MGFTKLEKSVLNVSALPDRVENQAQQLKATFDQAGADIKEAHNQLIDELDANTAAGNIGAVSATGAKTTVQAELNKLNDRIHVDFTELEIELDDELSLESENAVKNKAIAKEVNSVKGALYSVDRYNKPTTTRGQVSPDGVKVIGNAFPNDWTRVSAVEYTASNGDILTASGSTESTPSYRLNYAVDGEVSTSSHWLSLTSSKVGEHNQWIKIKLNTPINIKKMATFISTASMTLTSAVIQGSNDDEKWYDLYTISSKQTSLTEITLDNNNYYQYYRIYFTGQITSANSGHFIVYEWQTVEYMTKEDQVIHNINLPVTSYEVGKIVNIEGISYEGITSFENPYLNINNLGTKRINGTIVAGEKYSLVYNGERWDLAPKNYVVGTYTGDGTSSQNIDLGFKPSAIIVMFAQGTADDYVDADTHFPGFGKFFGMAIANQPQYTRSGAYSVKATIEIVDNGFNVAYKDDSSESYGYYTNQYNIIYSYIAFK